MYGQAAAPGHIGLWNQDFRVTDHRPYSFFGISSPRLKAWGEGMTRMRSGITISRCILEAILI
jgi:hypothetical protein